METVKVNKALCLRIIDHIHQLHCGIITACLATDGALPVNVLEGIGQLSECVLSCFTYPPIYVP
jgi:hypothetical protein